MFSVLFLGLFVPINLPEQFLELLDEPINFSLPPLTALPAGRSRTCQPT
jgi:hypothetical protein